jgi:DNA modification methylase
MIIKREVVIGDCRLLLGDCVEILPTLGRVDAVVTDPPYGVELGSDPTHRIGNRPYSGFDDTPDYVRDVAVWTIESCIGHARSVVVTPGTRCAWLYPQPDEIGAIYFPAGAGFSRWGFTCSQPILFYGKDPYMPRNKKPNSVASTEVTEKNGHPCPKPIKLMKWLVARATLPTDTVFDPFMGSGTTGVACVKLGRKFIGIEIDEGYFDIACERIRKAYAQPDMFIETARVPEPTQEALSL